MKMPGIVTLTVFIHGKALETALVTLCLLKTLEC
jgi:hypothetical protein